MGPGATDGNPRILYSARVEARHRGRFGDLTLTPSLSCPGRGRRGGHTARTVTLELAAHHRSSRAGIGCPCSGSLRGSRASVAVWLEALPVASGILARSCYMHPRVTTCSKSLWKMMCIVQNERFTFQVEIDSENALLNSIWNAEDPPLQRSSF